MSEKCQKKLKGKDLIFAPLIEEVDLDVAKSYITKLTNFYNDGILYC
ncbi:hypothetical protein SAMN04487775_11199 [Treponema bryantii]|uniref:Uncharacterized protein n=1 Tax=Treponema bryantii TaxID=163 RepID=A0A1I3N1R1_9SPIR|nr:hypothetical protein SAMN04487775_11199 [Treponema bryantii]